MHPSKRRIVRELLALNWSSDARQASANQGVPHPSRDGPPFSADTRLLPRPLSRLRGGEGPEQPGCAVKQGIQCYDILGYLEHLWRTRNVLPDACHSSLNVLREGFGERQAHPHHKPGSHTTRRASSGYGEGKRKYGWRRRHHHWAHTSDTKEGYVTLDF